MPQQSIKRREEGKEASQRGAGPPFSAPPTLRLPHPCAFCKGGRRRLQPASTFRITGFVEVPLAGLGRAIPLKFTPGGGWVRGSRPWRAGTHPFPLLIH